MATTRNVLLVLLLCGCESDRGVRREDFEGTITYDVVVESKVEGVTDEELMEAFGPELKLSIQGGSRKFEYSNNGPLIYQIQGDPLEYVRFPGGDTLYTRDLSTESDHLHYVRRSNRVAMVMGNSLSCVESRVGDVRFYYYYTSEYSADPAAFAGREFLGIDQVMAIAGAVALKTVFDGASFRVTETAKHIESCKLDASTFVLPSLPIEPLPD